ncbi:MAG: hypothetical protein M2R46_02840 [Verrucomicrobia subdivision 3 bacterium]|nr:hypothetical protein [Limisphaerales bacterium]
MLTPPLRLGQTQVTAIAHLRRTLEGSKAVPVRTLRSLRQSAGISRAPAWRWESCASNTLGGRCLKWVDIFISSMTVTLSAASLFPVFYAGGLASFHVRSSSKSKTARQAMYVIPFPLVV